jgi:hypothetical protein
MFIRCQVHVDRPADGCREALLGPPARWLPPSTVTEDGEGQLLARVGFGGGARIAKRVRLTVGTPVVQGDWLVVPISWRATGPSELFPSLDGTLRVEPLGPGRSRLTLSGTYEPPLGGLGREIDHAVMHRAAEATMADFVQGVSERLVELVSVTPT